MAEKFGEEYFECGTISNYQGYNSGKEFWKVLVENLIETYHPRKVLDVGCAKGFLVECFLDYGVEAYGVDISSYALSKAPIKVRPLLRQVDLNYEPIPFPDECFDLIICLDTLEHISELNNALGEMSRCLKKSGRIYTKIPKPEHPDVKKDATHVSLYSKVAWEDIFTKHCFKVKTIWPKSRGNILKKFPLPDLTRIIAYALKKREKFYWFELTIRPDR